ncbi:CopG family transcriptional regulator [candidate division KSB1 bacterium]|nr:MAG: CopG family transcriptional regulator [candidate division KSB1 bacterium]
MAAEFRNISIPTSLYEKIEEKIKGTNFSSIASFVTYILGKVVAENDTTETLSQEEEEQIKQKLQSLGYIE